ncbi:GAF and ANTAR domain-containing protein [Amycolatopsis samaneae]|uniref:GAF and ANTAR domain-containing protein n=1 Tax=Amycolatopsis samaneae TaxID=664691 RepID=A0ABW5GE18_9PSEU
MALRDLRQRMATLHRRTAERHRTSAELQALHATRLAAWIDENSVERQPEFATSVGAALGDASIVLTLVSTDDQVALSTASDGDATVARDAEFVSGEGPITDAVRTCAAVTAADEVLSTRWPHYAPSVRRAGVRAVLAVPLRQPISCVGALCLLRRGPTISPALATATNRVADALARTVLLPSSPFPDDDPLRLFVESSYQDVVHQAAGMLSVRHRCSPDDAVALLRARAFTEGIAVDRLARRVLRGEVSFD